MKYSGCKNEVNEHLCLSHNLLAYNHKPPQIIHYVLYIIYWRMIVNEFKIEGIKIKVEKGVQRTWIFEIINYKSGTKNKKLPFYESMFSKKEKNSTKVYEATK